ncbi:MAG: TonB-dependent receptor, partial [Pseudomonadota bacterium]|nr:TonB-dependent receptor [Pseudomonadota bacterium]
ALTVDYFNIKVKNVIGADAYGSVFDSCFGTNGATVDPAACARVHRDKFGSLWLTKDGYVVILNRNFPGVGLATKGFDLNGSYSHRLGGFGTFNASFVGTIQGKTATVGSQGTGTFSPDSIPSSKFRSKTRIGLTLPNGLGVSGAWRHFSSVKCAGSVNCLRPANVGIKAQNYFDLAMTARITNKFNLRFGANNILDRAPPVLGDQVLTGVNGSGNTYPQIYDALGRYMFAGVTVDF